jgi:predicted ABC-type ATPase
MPTPQLIFLAGPNGAGKSTFYTAELANLGLPFLNADILQKRIGVSDEEAATFTDLARRTYLEQGASFITETVFSDPVGAKLEFLRQAVALGYEVQFIYIGLSSPDLCDARVCTRVMTGGHDVPAERIPRRYSQSLINLKAAMRFLPNVTVYDNSGDAQERRCIWRSVNGQVTFKAADLPDWFVPILE